MGRLIAVAKSKLVESLIESIRNRSRNGFDISQRVVPVKTGNLKSTGEYSDIDAGSQIRYSAEYASLIERGRDATTIYVNPSVRRDGTLVRSHTMKQAAIQPRYFIKNSLTESFRTFADSTTDSLSSRFDKVIRM